MLIMKCLLLYFWAAREFITALSPLIPKETSEVSGLANLDVEDPSRSIYSCSPPCLNGVCDTFEKVCKCFPGWRGRSCEYCGGKIRLDSSRGWLADAIGNYSVNSKCTWLVEAPQIGDRIRLHIKVFATECGWDHLYIYDGDSVFSDLKAVFSGIVRDGHYKILKIPEVISTSGKFLIHFYSDVAYNMTGFNITFSINDCPSERHDVTCSRHGLCNKTEGNCQCDSDFVGEACSFPACPNNCRDPNGFQRGKCEKNRCICFEGWTGPSCNQAITDGYWKVLETNSNRVSLPRARTSHASMIDAWGQMWVVGGEMFGSDWNEMSKQMVATFQVPKVNSNGYDSAFGKWKEVHIQSNKSPSMRFGHSAVLYNQKIYMYGGTLRSGHTSKELWALDLDLLTWERVHVTQGQCIGQELFKVCGPLHSVGHSANIISNRMIVIFGHSPNYGFLDTVQEFHFGNREWSIIPTSGYPVQGGFGHSSVYDHVTNLVYVFGGFVSSSSTSAISNALYSYDPISRKWKLHSSSNSFRYLHSSVIIQGMMLTFGGNTHNDTAESHGAKCYSADFLLYDIFCDRWLTGQDLIPEIFDADFSRYGHSSVVHNDSMIVFGGFNGMLKNDVLAFVPGNCGIFKKRQECLKSRIGRKCVWNAHKDECQTMPQEMTKSSIEFCENNSFYDQSIICQKLMSCIACVSTSTDCVWCGHSCHWRHCSVYEEVDNFLNKSSLTVSTKHPVFMKEKWRIMTEKQCEDAGYTPINLDFCSKYHTCQICLAHTGCEWKVDKVAKCQKAANFENFKNSGNLADEFRNSPNCTLPCNKHTDCANCTHGLCMWCKNLHLCISRNAYLVSFPYGQCMEWTTQVSECPPVKSIEHFSQDICFGYQSCSHCLENPRCGWCDDGSKTGTGVCKTGGASGPMKKLTKLHGHNRWVKDENLCPQMQGMSWYFTDCPICQCNGHSICTLQDGLCNVPCANNTNGKNCERCANGYFGNPINGGSCQACQCNQQAKSCNNKNGHCYCSTKGIIGKQCEKCDKSNHYYGDPIKWTCLYELATDYQFTFNLSKPGDSQFSAINFKNRPTKVDVDVDFSISCSVPAKMNLSYQFASTSTKGQETMLFSGVNCSSFKEKFSNNQFNFGDSQNTTFFVYVYELQPPVWIVISFSQHPKLNLLQFFLIFSGCFLILLLIAAILWMIKQRYDRYRRRQRLFLEMEQMASRPFGSAVVEFACYANHGDDVSATSASSIWKKKQKVYPSPVALEPCEGNRAAVLSLIVKLPSGGMVFAPPGCSGVALASSLVTLGNHQKGHSDASSRQMVEDPKRKCHKARIPQPSDI